MLKFPLHRGSAAVDRIWFKYKQHVLSNYDSLCIYKQIYLCNNLLVNNIISTTAKSQVPTQTKNKLTNKEKKKVSRSQSWQLNLQAFNLFFCALKIAWFWSLRNFFLISSRYAFRSQICFCLLLSLVLLNTHHLFATSSLLVYQNHDFLINSLTFFVLKFFEFCKLFLDVFVTCLNFFLNEFGASYGQEGSFTIVDQIPTLCGFVLIAFSLVK